MSCEDAVLDAEELKQLNGRLRAMRDDLQLETEQAQDGTSPVELDQARLGRLSRMDEMQQQAMAVELDRRREIQLKRIEGAFLRLKKGSYGACTVCGVAIDAERLEGDPTVFFCIDCAERAEKR